MLESSWVVPTESSAIGRCWDASNGGVDQRPGWLHNLVASGSVEVQIGRRRFDGRAEVIGPQDTDYVKLWTLVNGKARRRYDRYQQQTARQFELVKLHPRE